MRSYAKYTQQIHFDDPSFCYITIFAFILSIFVDKTGEEIVQYFFNTHPRFLNFFQTLQK